MAKVDMHVHSIHSARPSEWFLQRLGTRESYTRPETIYHETLKRGMDFVTITDHNSIDGVMLLQQRYPEKVFTGLEATTYFPENGCKIHLLVYGLNEQQFRMIDMLRKDIYRLRDYIREQCLAHAVAHATYSINNRLAFEHIEKLLLLFDSFEGINGSRSRHANEALQNALDALTPERMEALSRKYSIEPFSDTSWNKSITGGTDDHGGLFIGKTYTEADAETPAEFLQALVRKKTRAKGRHNDYRGLAFSLYKIAYDFSCSHKQAIASPLLNAINRLLFDKKSLTFKNRLVLKKIYYSRTSGEIERLIAELINSLQKERAGSTDAILEKVHNTVAQLCDELLKKFATTFEENISQGNIMELVQCISIALPGLFLSLPFFTSLNILYESRSLIERLDIEYGSHNRQKPKKVLWISDGLYHHAPTSVLWKQYAGLRGHNKVEGVIVECCDGTTPQQTTKHERLQLPAVYSCELPFGSRRKVHIPSLLNTLKHICENHPDEIVVTSPGPMGLLGLLAAKLLHVPCAGIRYTNISSDVDHGDAEQLIDGYLHWFFSKMDSTLENLPATDVTGSYSPLQPPSQYGLPILKQPVINTTATRSSKIRRCKTSAPVN